MLARTSLGVILLASLTSSSVASDPEPVVFRITVTNQAGWGFWQAPIYASDSFSTGLVTEGEWESSIDISRDLFVGSSDIHIHLKNGVVTAEWDYSHALTPFPDYPDIWNPVEAKVAVEVFLPWGHIAEWQVIVQKASSGGTAFRKGDPTGTWFPDGVTPYGGSGRAKEFYWSPHPVIYNGHEYYQVFDY